MTAIYLDEHSLSLDEFATLCARQTLAHDYTLAEGVEKNVVIYRASTLLHAATFDRCKVLCELHHLLASGPGVFVVRGFYSDLSIIDRNSAQFEAILADEAKTHTAADHFAMAGNNGRIWNAFQKVAQRNANDFIDYYASPLLKLICESWLGPGYQITAQVNQVRPGGKAQHPHRDYHLGFQPDDVVTRFPLPLQILSQYMTLQGAVAHSDMPVESGPTLLLPWSQQYQPGYLAWRNEHFIHYFNRHAVQLPLSKGDGLFFNPALFHAAGANRTDSHVRTANLLQISSAFGKPMEQVDHQGLLKQIYPVLLHRNLPEENLNALIASVAEGYPFPTNLDRDPPLDGLASQTQQQLLRLALDEKWQPEWFCQQLDAWSNRRLA